MEHNTNFAHNSQKFLTFVTKNYGGFIQYEGGDFCRKKKIP